MNNVGTPARIGGEYCRDSGDWCWYCRGWDVLELTVILSY